MKTCKGCGQTLPLTDFYGNYKTRDGHLSWCKPCTVARYGASVKARAREWREYLSEIKRARGCVDCGYNAHPAALDFDHLPGALKLYRLAGMVGMSRALVDAEIAKCEVVCANCHRVRTATRKQYCPEGPKTPRPGIRQRRSLGLPT